MSTWPYERFSGFRQKLEKAATQWFRDQGFVAHSKYPYCLPSLSDWRNNIILPAVAEFVGDRGIRKHKYLHHGLSSQALAFNLLIPCLIRDDLQTLAESLAERPCDGGLEMTFEYQDREVFNEGSRQPTSIDAHLFGSGVNLFVEVKFQEKEFGGCSCVSEGNCEGMNPRNDHDLCYLHAGAKRTYWPVLERQGFLTRDFFNGPLCPLVRHYQFFREVAFALSKGGTFVLLVDARNPAFNRNGPTRRGLYPFLKRAVPTEFQDRLTCVTVQSVIDKLKQSGKHNDWLPIFSAKYGL